MKPDLLYKWWPLGFAKPGIYAYTCAHMQNQMFPYKGTGLEKVVIWAGWGSAGKCVSHILLPISISRQDLRMLSTGARYNRLSALSTFHLSLCPSFPLFLLACICFIAFLSFPHAITIIFPFARTSFSSTFSLLLLFHWFLPCFWPVSPFSLCLISSVLSNGSLGSFPHTLSFLAWVFPSSLMLVWLPYRYRVIGTRSYCNQSCTCTLLVCSMQLYESCLYVHFLIIIKSI